MSVLSLTLVPLTTVVRVRFDVSLKLLHSGAAVFGFAVPEMPALLDPDAGEGIMVFGPVELPGAREDIAVLEPFADAAEIGF